jgi:hypothetical protein
MRRGTTPTLQITVTGLSEIEIQNLYLTLEQQGVVIEKTEADVSIDSEVISATLTQEETLSLTAKMDVAMQLRVLSTNNTAYASNIVTVPVEAILEEITVSADMDLTDGKEIYYETTDDYEKLQNLPTLDERTIIGNINELDPTVPGWAKEANKPAYNAGEVGAVAEADNISLEYLASLFS